ncbi:MAG: hypothetical protein KPEEDBHJ_00255 [Anaerolineales bacterium]|nr:hypothetical protein [Anaerolineales bacterium]
MKKGDYLNKILRSEKTVFTVKDIVLLWREEDLNAVYARLNYYVKEGDLHRVRKGVYVKNEEYDRLELAVRIFTPAYVSFETVLAREGVIFQFQTAITVASYLARRVVIDKQEYSFRKIKHGVLLNPTGVKQEKNFSVANKERAFLDTLYNHTDYYFDNLRSLDWDTVFFMLPLYENRRMNRQVERLSLL